MHSTYKEKSLGFSIPFLSNEETIDDDKKSPDFIEFEWLCCEAYNILRLEGHKLINLFLIMLSAGMPELS